MVSLKNVGRRGTNSIALSNRDEGGIDARNSNGSGFIECFRSVLIVLLVSSLAVTGYAQTPPSNKIRRERRPSPIASEIFLGDWYDYYNRAIRRVIAGDRTGAESDLREALKLHPDDNPHARTYGVRFQEYYANLELGILLYETGRYSEALTRLKASLSTAPLEETRFYIHETQRKLMLETGEDRIPPRMTIIQPPTGLVTNQTSVVVRGTATDNVYVDEITIDNRWVEVPPAQSSVEFESEVPLVSGANKITLRVTDLVGLSQSVEFEVFVDLQGPILSLEKVELLAGNSRARLVGTVYDRHDVSSIVLNEVSVPTQNRTTVPLDVEVPLTAEGKRVRFVATDGFGNRTTMQIDPTMRVGAAPKPPGRTRVAAIGFDPRWLFSNPGTGPRIDLYGLKSGQKIYQDRICINARISDKDGVESVSFNGSPLDIPKGTDLSLSYLFGPLHDGTNTIEIRTKDSKNNETVQVLELYCKLLQWELEQQGLVVAVPPFDGVMENVDPAVAEILRNEIQLAIVQRKRFRWVESRQLDAVLVERQLGAAGFTDTRYRAADQSLLEADLVLDVQIVVREDTVYAYGKAVAVRDGEVENAFDAHGRTDSFWEIKKLAEEIALKLEAAYPRVEGDITKVDPQVVCTLTRETVRPGTRLLAVRKGKEMILPDGQSAGAELTVLGPMKVFSASPDGSIIEPEAEMTDGPIVGDIVVTR